MSSIQPIPKVLLISSEDSSPLLNVLEEAGFKVEFYSDIAKAENDLKSLRPDLLLVNSDMTGDHGLNFCQYVRSCQISPRPIIVFLVNEYSPDERIEVLRSGADDAISFPVPGKEIAFRVMAHLRRRHETHVNSLTGLPDARIANNVIENVLQTVDDWALLSIDLDNLRVYNETYGEVRGDQMIQALAAVSKSVLTQDDFLAHRDSDDFILITRSGRAEATAEEICRRFDYIAPRFYTKEDAKRNYVIGVGARGIKRRVPLVSISIGVTAKGRRNFVSSIEILEAARYMRYLAKGKNGSDWVSDRLRIPSSGASHDDKRIKILVVEPDASLALLLKDTLEMEGYHIEVAHSTQEAWNLINSWRPELILLEVDVGKDELNGWELTQKLKQVPELAGIWIIMATKNPDHDKALDCGADLYLPKPFELQVLFSEVKYLLRARIRSKVLL